MKIGYNLKMKTSYGKPYDSVHRINYLAAHKKPLNCWYLAPNGFHKVEHEYDFMFQTIAPRAFVTPDGQVRTLRAVNINWETLTRLEKECGVDARELAAEAFKIASAIECDDQNFDQNILEAVIILIWDKDEERRWSMGLTQQL